jgi:hypothetical protein
MACMHERASVGTLELPWEAHGKHLCVRRIADAESACGCPILS